MFENCAEQYRFFKELEFAAIRESPMLFGTLVHQTIEDIHKTVLRGEESSITFDTIKGWFSANYAMLSKKERVYLAPARSRRRCCTCCATTSARTATGIASRKPRSRFRWSGSVHPQGQR